MAKTKMATKMAKLRGEAKAVLTWADGRLAKFTENLAADPAFAMRWSGEASDAAASREVAQAILDTRGRFNFILKFAVDRVLSMAEHQSRSTSATADQVDYNTMRAWAHFARVCLEIQRGIR